MDEFLLKTLPSLGIGGVLAAVLLYINQKNNESHERRLEEYASVWKDQSIHLSAIVEKNTVSQVRLTDVVSSLHNHLIYQEKLADRRDLEKRLLQ